MSTGSHTSFPPRAWALALLTATLLATIISAQNALRFPGRGWAALLLFELPVWYAWLLLSPLIVAVSRRFPLASGRWARNLAVHLVSSAVAIVVAVTITHVARLATAPPEMLVLEMSVGQTVPRVFGFFLIVYFAIVALEHAMHYHQALSARLVEEAELRALLARSQLDALRLQLQPHFLFNTMNMISSLMGRDVHAARRMMTDLSQLFRATLRNAERHEVTLEEEVDFVSTYVRIQESRFDSRLGVHLDIQAEALEELVPRMLLQPLVENAIVHANRGPGVRTNVRIEAAMNDGGSRRLRLVVADDGPGFPAGDELREGIGLANTRARLRQLYGDDHRFDLLAAPEGGAMIRIELPGTRTSDDRLAHDRAS